MRRQNSRRRPIARFLAISAFALFGMGFLTPRASVFGAPAAPSPATVAVEATLEKIFMARARALLLGREKEVVRFYDTGSLYGRWAMEHELRRLRYLQAWTRARGIKLLDVRARIGIRTVDPRPSGVWVFLVQHLQVDYGYAEHKSGRCGRFGIGTRHCLELVKKENKWYIRRDWFIDPLEEDAVVDEVRPAEGFRPYTPLANTDRRKYPGTAEGYDRQAAVAYADKYAGLARGIEGRYNPAYRDYTYAGGDCTNFVS